MDLRISSSTFSNEALLINKPFLAPNSDLLSVGLCFEASVTGTLGLSQMVSQPGASALGGLAPTLPALCHPLSPPFPHVTFGVRKHLWISVICLWDISNLFPPCFSLESSLVNYTFVSNIDTFIFSFLSDPSRSLETMNEHYYFHGNMVVFMKSDRNLFSL